MGLTKQSVSIKANGKQFKTKTCKENEKVIALAGNPNVGKSTVFNALTGLCQHTGNWSGKTVCNACGSAVYDKQKYIFVDIPGTYSLMSSSKEEEIARDFICFGNADVVAVVCDASCLERNLYLVLQTLEITKNVVVCVNLLDEAKRKNISVNLKQLSQMLGVKVVGMCAKKGEGTDEFLAGIKNAADGKFKSGYEIKYPSNIENAVNIICDALVPVNTNLNLKWVALRILEGDVKYTESIKKNIGASVFESEKFKNAIKEAYKIALDGKEKDYSIADDISQTLLCQSEKIYKTVVKIEKQDNFDLKVDKILTGRFTAVPIMLLLLAFVFWLTICASNGVSDFLSDIFYNLEQIILNVCIKFDIKPWLYEPLLFGVYRVSYWVVSVMFPPMAIFFPLFTLLEDLGYLPRIAFNLDNTFKKCCACGKQALTMCMGFGCNAAGVVGCRIITSPRERLIAILTNSFVPCNGRIPILILVASMFFSATALSSAASAVIVTFAVILGVGFTFAVSKILSKTLLKGEVSSFVLELPPYRKPQIGSVIIRSMFDRTIFVLARAASVAAPAGLIIWILANVDVSGGTLLVKISEFLDPMGKVMGMDGVILLAFILGFPANELVIPLAFMMYMSTQTLTALPEFSIIKDVFISNGWSVSTAVCVMIFSLMHWPCSTTLITIKKETGSLKWCAAAFLIPTLCGVIMCILINACFKIFGI